MHFADLLRLQIAILHAARKVEYLKKHLLFLDLNPTSQQLLYVLDICRAVGYIPSDPVPFLTVLAA